MGGGGGRGGGAGGGSSGTFGLRSLANIVCCTTSLYSAAVTCRGGGTGCGTGIFPTRGDEFCTARSCRDASTHFERSIQNSHPANTSSTAFRRMILRFTTFLS